MSRENVHLARIAYQAFNSGDLETALAHMDPEIEWHQWGAFGTPSAVFHGHDGVREVLGILSVGFERFQAEPKEFVDAGAHVMVPVRLRGWSRANGEEVRADLVHVWSTRDGKAVRLDVYASRSDALKALARAERSHPSHAADDQS